MIKEGRPDCVIVATGARPIIPSLPGVEKRNVVTAWQVLNKEFIPMGEIVVLGGGQVGAETAEYLAEKGNRVTIIEMLDEIAVEMHESIRQILLFSLEDFGVNILTKATVERIEEKGVVVNHRGKEEFVKADIVVVALGASPDQELSKALEKLGVEFHMAGDCGEVRQLPQAVEEGFKTALKV